VYPALTAVAELRQRCDGLDVRWIGSSGGLEQPLIERAGIPFDPIPALGLRGKSLLATLHGLWTLGRGYRRSRQLIERFGPDALFVTGGYVSVPVTLAAWRAGIPVLIYLPDIEPGLAIKFLARFADGVAVSAPEAQSFFKPGLTVVTGYPVRPELFAGSGERSTEARPAARRRLGLSDELPVLLVFGGSRGARSINRALTDYLEAYLEVCQVIHISGTLDADWVQTRRTELPSPLQDRYHHAPYLHEDMVAALLAADLVVSRAGASVIGEYPAAGLPAILVPGPFAGAHQALNAAYLARPGAALVVEDADLDRLLKDTVFALITNKEKLQLMRQATQRLAQPEAAARLAREILRMGTHGT